MQPAAPAAIGGAAEDAGAAFGHSPYCYEGTNHANGLLPATLPLQRFGRAARRRRVRCGTQPQSHLLTPTSRRWPATRGHSKAQRLDRGGELGEEAVAQGLGTVAHRGPQPALRRAISALVPRAQYQAPRAKSRENRASARPVPERKIVGEGPTGAGKEFEPSTPTLAGSEPGAQFRTLIEVRFVGSDKREANCTSGPCFDGTGLPRQVSQSPETVSGGRTKAVKAPVRR
jgi:hypothetical protein